MELSHDVFGGVVHQVETAHVIWLVEVVLVRESVERVAVDPDDDPGVPEQRLVLLKVFDVLESGAGHLEKEAIAISATVT